MESVSYRALELLISTVNPVNGYFGMRTRNYLGVVRVRDARAEIVSVLHALG
jgi:hypothetical protein